MKRLNRLIVLALVIGTPWVVQAGDGPESVTWNCMDVGAAGLKWNGDTDTYRDSSFFQQQHRIVQTRDQLSFPQSIPFKEGTRCGFRPNIPVLTCDDGVRIFNLNVQTGYATHSKTYGWMDPYSRPPAMFVAAAICNRI